MIKIEFRGSEVGETLWHSYELPTEEKTGRTLPSRRPMELLNSSIHRSRGKKNEGGLVRWKRRERDIGGLTGAATVAVTTFVDR